MKRTREKEDSPGMVVSKDGLALRAAGLSSVDVLSV